MITINSDEIQNLSEITLIVPTYNRQQYAIRQLNFWSGTPVTLHVIDGTNMPIINNCIEGLEDNVHYHHIPCSLEERFGKSIAFIKTPYASLLCDDEFFIPSALHHGIQCLKNNEEFVACSGKLLAYHTSKKGISGKALYTKSSSIGAEENFKIDGTTARERMMAHIFPWENSLMYAVQSSKVLKNSLAIISKYKFSTQYVQEIQIEFATCYQGKSITIKELMLLKNYETEAIRFNENIRALRLVEWAKDSRYKNEVKKFYELTATELAKINREDKEKAYNDFKLAVEKELYYENNSFVILNIIRHIPKKIRKIIKMISVDYIWKPIIQTAIIMQKEGIVVDLEQLEEIVDFIKLFKEKNNLTKNND